MAAALRRTAETLRTTYTPPIQRTLATVTSTPDFRLSTGIVLNRSPIITPTPPPFAQSYYNYNYKLHRALSTPFPQDFYFKKGSNLQQRFFNEEKDRDAKSFGVGFGKGARLRLPPLPYDKPQPRTNEADVKGDVKSLDRLGERNLYLVLKNKDGLWRLPQGVAAEGEALHVAARNQLISQCGADIDTWIVGRQPVGFHEDKDKIFFFKAHIFAGQVSLTSDASDFAWLTKQEIGDRISISDEAYWSSVKDILHEY